MLGVMALDDLTELISPHDGHVNISNDKIDVLFIMNLKGLLCTLCHKYLKNFPVKQRSILHISKVDPDRKNYFFHCPHLKILMVMGMLCQEFYYT